MGASTFPAFTSKQLAFGQVKAELAAFLHGETTLEGFHKWGCKIWDANAANHHSGEIGRVYGAQWRTWPREGSDTPVDQLKALVAGIKADPFSRRHILQSYNPGATSACLPACHMSAQFYVLGDKLNCTVTMRSCDLFLGLPFDVASYALLTHLVCKELGFLSPGTLTFNICDAHIYKNHQQAVRDVLERNLHKLPHLVLEPEASLFDFDPKHAALENYVHSGSIPAPMNVHEEPKNAN
jgi:thymidylate synthase